MGTERVGVVVLVSSWGHVGRVVLTGLVLYAYLIALLRVSGKRTLAKLNAFDLVVTVALGSVLATVIVSRDVSWLEAGSAMAVLVGSQFVVAWASSRSALLRGTVRAEPTVVLRDGCALDAVMRANRITSSDLAQAIRASGYGGCDVIAAVVLETDGSLSVVPEAQRGDGTTLPRTDGASAP